MMYRRSDKEGLARAFRGENTGYVLRWSPASRWSRIPGTEGPMPNGVQSTPDGRNLYVAMWGASRVVKLELAAGKAVGSVNTPHPDNLSWAPDGRLFATGPETMPSYTECRTGREDGCFAPSHVDAIDTRTMQVTPIFRFEKREMLPASVAAQVGRTLYVGSYDGDHLLEVDLDAANSGKGATR
jgi:sugar lactone lactonase YvrE